MGTFIVFFAQLAGRGGIVAWPIGLSGVISSYIALLAFQKSADIQITKSDWTFFFVALSTLPLWFFTTNPLWAVITLTLSDSIGFGPTIRRAYHHPHDESLAFFMLGAVRNLLVVLALEQYSLTTILFPAAVGVACLLFGLMLIYRRHSLQLQQQLKISK